MMFTINVVRVQFSHPGRAGFEVGGASRLKRRIVERVLTRCAEERNEVGVAPLLTLLRRFAAEAAREEARLFCHELAADTGPEQRLAA
jgi:hypothetical protein